MKALLVTIISLFAVSAFAYDTTNCVPAKKKGYLVCHMENCMIGDAYVGSCTVTIKDKQSSAPQAPQACQNGEAWTPGCVSNIPANHLPPTTQEQKEKFEKKYQEEIDQYNKAGG